jgi:putative ABC transport system permease protein
MALSFRLERPPGLGLQLLGHNRMRLFLAAASIAFGVVVMLVEMGLLTGVLDSQAMIATLVRGDLVVMDAARINLHRWNAIDSIRLSQIAAVPGVARVIPVYEGHVGLKSPDDGRVRRIIVYAVPPEEMPLAIGDSDAVATRLKFTHGFLYDTLSRPIFGHIRPGQEIEIDKYPLRVNGTVAIGPDIVNDGAILMSEGDWQQHEPGARPLMGVIRLAPGTDVETARANILAALPPDITVLTPKETRARENAATLASAPVGILFAIGVLAGLVIGTINCYQLLYNEVSDHLAQYATLKAMGFSENFLRQIILEQSVILALAGFAVGLALAFAADALIGLETRLPVRVTAGSGLLVCLLTVGMCILAGGIAIRRVAVADPAALY